MYLYLVLPNAVCSSLISDERKQVLHLCRSISLAWIDAGEQEELRMEMGTEASLQEDLRGAGSLGGLGQDESYFHSPWLSVCSQSCCGSVVIAV